jgi:hypothetical protein
MSRKEPTMNNSQVIMYKDFDASLINFDVVSKNKMGGKMVRVTYGPNKQPVRIQSPDLYLPFGVGTYTDEKTGEVVYSIDAALKGYQDNPKVKAFHDVLLDIDKRILDTCVESSPDWLGKPMSKEVVQEFFRPLVKPPRDEKYSPLFKIKISPVNKSGGLPKVFDMKDPGNPKDMDFVIKGSTARFIVTIPSVWFVNKTFGVSARLFQAAVTSRPIQNENFAFAREDDDEDASGETAPIMEEYDEF